MRNLIRRAFGMTTNIVNVDSGNNIMPDPVVNAYGSLALPAYWRGVNFLANNLASFPRTVRRDDPDAADEPHPLTPLLKRRPNGYQNAFALWRTWFYHAVHGGNAFIRIERDSNGTAVALHTLDPADAAPFRYRRTADGPLQQWYAVRGLDRPLPGADVLHLAGLGNDGMAGIDPVSLHAATLQQATTLARFQTRYLMKGTVIRGAIEIPTSASPERIAEIQNVLRRFFHGPDAERDVIVLSDGATMKNVTLTPEQSQIFQQVTQSTKQIAQILGVDPEFLYEKGEAKYVNNVEAAGQNAVRYTFRPWIVAAEAELTMKLLTTADQEDGYSVRFNADALLRGDTLAQVNAVIATTNAGLRTRNEGRRLLDLPRHDDPESDTLATLGGTPPASPGGSSAPSPKNEE